MNERFTITRWSLPCHPAVSQFLGTLIGLPLSSHTMWTLPKFNLLTSSSTASKSGWGNLNTSRKTCYMVLLWCDRFGNFVDEGITFSSQIFG